MNPPKERNIPASSSPLAPPKLTPKTGPLKVGGRGGGEDPVPEEGHDQEHEPPTTPPRPGRTRGGRRPPPAAADAIPTTIRFDPEESAEVDQFVLELRLAAQRRNLDKAEVFREVLRLAREHEATRRALLRRLR
ncbi:MULTISPECIES: hypothetical protein [Streptomyces]|uniref:hypothetical protein n=1 Tax=Streptomyces TaxID=1883 RepID=UPI0004BD36C9|nr:MULTISPECIES: hypothetical protein [unclassified Streptomyces]